MAWATFSVLPVHLSGRLRVQSSLQAPFPVTIMGAFVEKAIAYPKLKTQSNIRLAPNFVKS
jgi:hypothetical protein